MYAKVFTFDYTDKIALFNKRNYKGTINIRLNRVCVLSIVSSKLAPDQACYVGTWSNPTGCDQFASAKHSECEVRRIKRCKLSAK